MRVVIPCSSSFCAMAAASSFVSNSWNVSILSIDITLKLHFFLSKMFVCLFFNVNSTMKKHLLLLLTCFFLTPASFAGEYNGNAPLFDGESWKWLNMNLVLFVGGFLLFLYIVRRLYEARLRMSDKNRAAVASAKKD